MIYLILLFISFYLLLITIFTQHTAWIEVLVYPYLLNNGFILYKDLIAPYTPIFLWVLQVVFGTFGYTPSTSIFMTVTLAIINVLLIFSISRNLWKSNYIGLFSAAFYSLWFFYFGGNGVWFELFQTPFILGAFYFLYKYFSQDGGRRNFLYASLLISFSFFIKQSAIWILIIMAIWALIIKKDRFNNLKMLSASFILILGVTSLIAILGGYVNEYWQWSFIFTFFEFPFGIWHQDYPSVIDLINLCKPLTVLLPLLLIFKRWNKKDIFCVTILVSSFMAILPRWDLFHLQPFLGLLSIIALPHFIFWFKNHVNWQKTVAVLLILMWIIVSGRQIERFWDKPTRFFEPAIYKLAHQLKQKDYKDFYIVNGSDQLYVLTNEVPKVKPYVQYFPWYLEVSGIQQKVINNLEKNQVIYLIFSPFKGYKPIYIAEYIEAHYSLKEKLSEDIWILERTR